MPSTTIWKNTPNKKDHLTNGYTSKTLFNFQYPDDGFFIYPNSYIFKEIINNGGNYKGSNQLPKNYFNCDDGRTLKISMLFDKYIDGIDIDLIILLEGNEVGETIGITKDIFKWNQCELVFYITKYFDPTVGANFSMMSGKLTRAPEAGYLVSSPVRGSLDIPDISVPISIEIHNKVQNEPIKINSLIIEEIS